MEVHVLIYTKTNCPYCVRAKQFFKEKNIIFEEVDLTNDSSELDKLKGVTGFLTLPQIFINHEFVGGYADLIEKFENGEIEELK